MADNVAYTAGAGTTIAADEVIDGTLGTVKVQIVKLMDGTLDSANKLVIDANGAMRVKDQRSATSAQSSVTGAAADTTILASNANRLGATVYNEQAAGGATLYLLLASGTSSVTNYSVQLGPSGFYELPFGYTGILKGIWSAASGAARVTEFTA